MSRHVDAFYLNWYFVRPAIHVMISLTRNVMNTPNCFTWLQNVLQKSYNKDEICKERWRRKTYFNYTPLYNFRGENRNLVWWGSQHSVKLLRIHSFFYIRTSFIRRSGSISRKFKKILRRSRGWILENFEKIEAEMCVYYINLRRSGSIFWKIKKI